MDCAGPRYSVPGSRGAFLSREAEDALWQQVFMAQPARRRTIKEVTVKVFPYETLASLSAHLHAFVTAYTFAKHLKALQGRTPFQRICDAWTKAPEPFKINPHHLIPGPYT